MQPIQTGCRNALRLRLAPPSTSRPNFEDEEIQCQSGASKSASGRGVRFPSRSASSRVAYPLAEPRLMRHDDILEIDHDAVLDLLACPAMMAVAREFSGRGTVPLQLDILYKHEHPHPVILWHQGAPHPRSGHDGAPRVSAEARARYAQNHLCRAAFHCRHHGEWCAIEALGGASRTVDGNGHAPSKPGRLTCGVVRGLTCGLVVGRGRNCRHHLALGATHPRRLRRGTDRDGRLPRTGRSAHGSCELNGGGGSDPMSGAMRHGCRWF